MGLKYDRKMSIYLTEDLRARLQVIADSKGTRVSNLIREILINYLENK